MDPFAQQRGNSEPTNTYLILTTTPGIPFEQAMTGSQGGVIFVEPSAVIPPGPPSPQTSSGTTVTPGSSSPPLPPIPRARLATWTFSPDSGYSDQLASPTGPDSPNPVFGAAYKRKFNSTENLNLKASTDMGYTESEILTPARLASLFTPTAKKWPQFPSRLGQTEIAIVRQPEAQHRPRYETEGSRGRIKDRTGTASPAVQLKGFNGNSAILHVFIGEERDPVAPHPLYKVCKVNNKHSAPAIIRKLDNRTTVLEMAFSAKDNWTLSVDCVSIMKMRNADFEEMTTDPEDLKKTKRKAGSPKIRLIFRAICANKNGQVQVLQVASSPISCCATPGLPEITFVSHKTCPVVGGVDVVVIGKNFIKNDTKLIVMEKNNDDDVVWQSEALLRKDKFNPVHLVASIPPYRDLAISKPVDVCLVVKNGDGKQSEPHKLQYTPDDNLLREPTPPPPPSVLPSTSAVIPKSVVLSSPSSTQSAQIFQPSVSTVSSPTTGMTSNCVHYCLQLPGSLQPLIITIPHAEGATMHPPIVSAVEQPPFASHSGMEQRHYALQDDTPADYDTPTINLVDYLQSSQAESLSDYPSTSADAELYERPERTETAQTAEDSEQAVFDELLREILGPDQPSNTQALDALLPNVAAWSTNNESERDETMDTSDYSPWN
ncbi:nuclear factor of activated T-cells 5-like isoform X2 [Paramacrobiotus metropolitanus]|uniref:nuclear factor of activated T-cells 5-like isoform X2 n=1 Tax=Paramacrobiotus metropolitanus TaxID=2943436 RepID=UPI002445952C|nr:nuclear factor of activated T-cells 5-like isoform X2 [Paramacrobiotus metropolitanus]